MSNKTEQKAYVALEVEMFESQRDALVISSKTKVLEHGRITRFDWEGDVFNEVDTYRQMFDLVPTELMAIATQYENLKDEDFINELQLAIKRAVTPIIKAKRKAILEGKNE